MRATAIFIASILLLVASPTAPADVRTGTAGGVEVAGTSGSLWDTWYVQVDGTEPIDVRIELRWEGSILGVDLDLTLWNGDAADDGALTGDEILATSWTRSRTIHQESIQLELEPGEYLITVEPVWAQGQSYTLHADGKLIRAYPGAVGFKGDRHCVPFICLP